MLTATIGRFYGQRRGLRSANDTAAHVAGFAIRGLLREPAKLEELLAPLESRKPVRVFRIPYFHGTIDKMLAD